MADGGVCLVDLDPLAQQRTLEIRAALWQDGRLVDEEEHTLQECLYSRHELELMLAHVGWVNVAVLRGYSDVPATADDTMLVFVAREDA